MSWATMTWILAAIDRHATPGQPVRLAVCRAGIETQNQEDGCVAFSFLVQQHGCLAAQVTAPPVSLCSYGQYVWRGACTRYNSGEEDRARSAQQNLGRRREAVACTPRPPTCFFFSFLSGLVLSCMSDGGQQHTQSCGHNLLQGHPLCPPAEIT